MFASPSRIGCLVASLMLSASAGATCPAPASSTSTLLSVSVMPAATPAAPAAAMGVDCVRAFSKDFCEGFVYPGHGVESSCGPVGAECRTLRVTGATMDLPFKRNHQQCSDDGKCDEAERKDGSFKVAINYTMRLHKPCLYRACLDGRGELRAIDGSVYAGTLMGTIGVGTHRDFACPLYRTGTCEKCIDVEYIPDIRQWRLGFEAAFHGRRTDLPDGTEVCFTISGDFYAAGDANGPFDLTGNFKTYGTADGIFLDNCFP
jgi:hypothetical protein